MVCTSPSLAVPGAPLGVHWDPAKELSTSPVSFHYGFVMDDVRTVRNVSGSGLRGMMVAYPDPTFELFDDGVKQFFYSKNEYLIINVSHQKLIGCDFNKVNFIILMHDTCLLIPISNNASIQIE